MTRLAPILASEKSAARLLDMKLPEFLELVREGHLPRGKEIAPGYVRWCVDDLKSIANGDASDGMGEVKW
ncbi:MAG: hypothetical protein ACQKBT_12360 [Puniceicoccales bacterium]